jgi:hypothetical protein
MIPWSATERYRETHVPHAARHRKFSNARSRAPVAAATKAELQLSERFSGKEANRRVVNFHGRPWPACDSAVIESG